jgi:hypothetical protein
MLQRLTTACLTALWCTGAACAQDASPSYLKEIQPFLAKYCVQCHKSGNAKAGIVLDSYEGVIKGGRKGRKLVVAGQPDDSRLVTTTEGNARPTMPPRNAKVRPTDKEIALLRAWVAAGAKDDTPANVKLPPVPMGWEIVAQQIGVSSGSAVDSEGRQDRSHFLSSLPALMWSVPSLTQH